MDAAVETRNIFALMESHPEVVRDGVALRSFGQRVIERLAGKRIHPDWIVPGGVTTPLKPEHREEILAEIPEMIALVQRTLGWFKRATDDYQDEARTFANFPTLFMSLVNQENTLELYRGRLRVVDASGKDVLADFHRDEYESYIGEAVEPDSYLKSPYYLPMGYPDGIYRVGPLARLNIIDEMGTPLADQELLEFRGLNHLSSFYFHQARLIECLNALEVMQQLFDKESILKKRVRAHASANFEEGIGVTEAPRGTLIHHFKVDEQGLAVGGNLVVATTHNNLAMNRGIQQAARRYIDGTNITDGALNRVEAVIRTFDPCLSCSTHAAGHLALRVQLFDAEGALLDEVTRG
jgi:NAD-reducing hydrogenase large subunit